MMTISGPEKRQGDDQAALVLNVRAGAGALPDFPVFEIPGALLTALIKHIRSLDDV